MKPMMPAIGVLSSWLALATKSARMRSARRSAVVSCSTISASEPSAAARGRRRAWAITSRSGVPDKDEIDGDLVGADEVAVGRRRAANRSPPAARDGAAPSRGRGRARVGAEQQQRRAVGAHDAALAVDRDQRIGQAVDDRLRRGGEIVDRGALAAPAGGERRRRGRQLLGRRREGKARHHRLLLARQLAHEAGEAGQRAEIALHQDHGDHGDAEERQQRRAAGERRRSSRGQRARSPTAPAPPGWPRDTG